MSLKPYKFRWKMGLSVLMIMCMHAIGSSDTVNAQNAMAERILGQFPFNEFNAVHLDLIIDHLRFEQTSRIDALHDIARRANLRISHDTELPTLYEKIDLELNQITVQNALWAVLNESGVRFAISQNGQLALFPFAERPIKVVNQYGSIGGYITDARSNEPLMGATVMIDSLKRGVVAGDEGQFLIENVPAGSHVLSFSYVGYRRLQQSILVRENQKLDLNIALQPQSSSLQELEVVSTGYQEIPKERATGSFVQLDETTLNRRVSTNILDRLEDITPGLIFNRTSELYDPITIRGRSTINANPSPLIIIDNFPYDGEIENINPNDVEKITVLKDAAAASIWGAQAGNGVIVITTKKASYQSKPSFSFTSNTTIGEKPELFYEPTMSISDFIDVEIALFNAGRLNSRINSSTKPILTPVVEALLAVRNGTMSQSEADQLISQYRTQDTRREQELYFYQESVNQQYAFNIQGGTETQRYIATFGYDQNQPSYIGETNQRFTLGGNHTIKLLGDRLELTTALTFIRNYTSSDRDQYPSSPYSPYDQFVDENGNEVGLPWRYRLSYTESINNPDLLDWRYFPLQERGKMDRSRRGNDFRTNVNLNYRIIDGLQISGLYQYWQNNSLDEHYRSVESFHTRDLVNRYAQVQPDGSTTFPVPKGGILSWNNANSLSHQGRVQINYQKNIGERHSIVTLAGAEVKHYETGARDGIYYGYNPDYGTSITVDHTTDHTFTYPSFYTRRIPSAGNSHTFLVDRFISYFANAAYTLDSKYTFTLSARKDASNLFGVETNQKGVPLWSAGVSWNISDENFYNVPFLPYLKARMTIGYNGNIDKSLSAYLTANRTAAWAGYLPGFDNLEVSTISNPANPNLKWERVLVGNFGIDFQALNGRISGSLDAYSKAGMDLIGVTPMAPQTGRLNFTGNFADTQTRGFDAHIRVNPVQGIVNWDVDLIYSFVQEKVTGYDVQSSVSNYVSASIAPLVGRPLHAVYSYEWGGLDPQTGEPMGYLNGELSKDYNAIMQAYTPETLVYHGSGRPTQYGSIRNTVTWKGISLSANVAIRLSYFVNRYTINYTSLYSSNPRFSHSDYALRWQQPGDELHTDVPSAPENFIMAPGRQVFENYASNKYVPGDHIRLQDVRLGYSLPSNLLQKLPLSRGEIFLYANNLGLLWKKADISVDPDYPTDKPQRTISVGIKLDF